MCHLHEKIHLNNFVFIFKTNWYVSNKKFFKTITFSFLRQVSTLQFNSTCKLIKRTTYVLDYNCVVYTIKRI